MNEIYQGEISEEPRTILSLEWKVPGLLDLPKQTNLRVTFPLFSYLGSQWSVCIFPNVRNEPNWIGMFLVKYTNAHEQQITYNFGIKDRDGTVFASIRKDRHFEYYGGDMGRWKFVKKTSLPGLSVQGSHTFFCTLHSKGKELEFKRNSEGAEKVIENLKGLLLSGDASDLTLKVQNRDFKVHSAILAARTPVFASMMRHDMKERRSRVIEIQDSDPDAFQQFLSFIYSGDTEYSSMDTVCDLFTIADKYDVEELKASCIQFMEYNLSVETLCDVLILAMRHDESELLLKATRYFAKNMKKILGTARWLSFVKENPVQAIELHSKAVDHLALLQ